MSNENRGAAPHRAEAEREEFAEPVEGFRAGFLSFVGRPNAGKSTLTNALVGDKVAITSNKPQTTRHAIRGIVHGSDFQLVLVDTPGLHRPRTLLGKRLNELVAQTLADVDAIAFCIPADEPIGPGDRFIAQHIRDMGRKPLIAIVTKADRVSRQALGEQLLAVQKLGESVTDGEGWTEIIPVSATAGFQVDEVARVLAQHMPVSPPLYPLGSVTDDEDAKIVSELVREAALEGVRDELPHSLAATVEEILPREGRPADRPLLDVRVTVYVERPSQKAIIIGKGGSRLKHIGATARPEIERRLGSQVHLDLHVKVLKDWQRDPKQLNRLGF
ncbi:GTPase Era [Falsarthrobacter nasiphocae]|uniref:GTPase Era n=1 Tax=Falsarthrobacter nasiphocae TaxID=189863 RepID=A0AAE3YFZ7_9MICC|nr:GTPase Era [Falsarthrobacter nasiphocae]MDR6891076.1 GTP-binding protein Era [Falsarthrobacter nasiphocae]